MPFTTLTDEGEKELRRLSRFYWQEAVRCQKAKAYLAGCVMLGSALETLLILMVNAYSHEVDQTGKVPMVKGKPKPLVDWQFVELLRAAKAAQWLPSTLDLEDRWSKRKARIGDYAEVVRQVRNLAHPARYTEDHHGKRVTRKSLQRQFEIVLLSRDWLSERNDKFLREQMKEEGLA